MTLALVVHGPSVWVDRHGMVVKDEGDFVVVRLEDKDDAGHASYDVRFPRTCLTFEEEVDLSDIEVIEA